MLELTREDRLLLELLQGRFPLSVVPFTDLAERLGWTESAVLARIAALKESGPLRQIGAIFDSRRLGYASTLVALAVQPERLEEVGAATRRHPGISHSYSREHTFNLWLTLAVPPGADLEGEVQALAALPGVRHALSLPVVRTFKIDARRFDLEHTAHVDAASCRVQMPRGIMPRLRSGDVCQRQQDGILDSADIPFVRALQEDLPLVQRPFHLLAVRAGVSEGDLLAAARRLLASGIMRRYGGTLRHHQAGYIANAMAAWDVPAECREEAGWAAAGHRAVSHCYERRPAPPDWTYPLFTMVHGRSPAELAATIAELEERIQPLSFVVLPTVKEFKKARLRYFEP